MEFLKFSGRLVITLAPETLGIRSRAVKTRIAS